MNVEFLNDAEMALDACGRSVPAPGLRYVDLPYILPWHIEASAANPFTVPQQQRVENSTKTAFIIKGVTLQPGPFAVRIKWPSGRYFSQRAFSNAVAVNFGGAPNGTGGSMFTLGTPEVVRAGAKIAIECSLIGAESGDFANIYFFGVLRYYMGPSGKLPTIPDPVGELEKRPRYTCGPSNIMAPEWLLGNQCQPETPDGFEDEPFTFFSPAISVVFGSQVSDVAVIVPGADDVIIRRVRALSSYNVGEGSSATPIFAMRLPNGFSLTGGDLVPCSFMYWWPWLPSTKVPAGQRILIDMADTRATGEGTITTVFEFDGIKRRRRLA